MQRLDPFLLLLTDPFLTSAFLGVAGFGGITLLTYCRGTIVKISMIVICLLAFGLLACGKVPEKIIHEQDEVAVSKAKGTVQENDASEALIRDRGEAVGAEESLSMMEAEGLAATEPAITRKRMAMPEPAPALAPDAEVVWRKRHASPMATNGHGRKNGDRGGAEIAENGEEMHIAEFATPAGAAPDLWQAFMMSFRKASYVFNPPSPIKVDRPKTVHLWVDTVAGQQQLATELMTLVPEDADRVETGQIRISPEIEAKLTGKNFIIKANSPVRQRINMEGRTIWSWDVTPTWPGKQMLHLRLVAIPPPEFSSPYTIPVPLDRNIEVKVTLWWLIDHFYEKYWKFLLGGLGTLFMTVLGWWWRKRASQQG